MFRTNSMVKSFIRIVVTMALVLIFLFASTITVSAELGGFSVTPVFPDNQLPETRGFFDLMVTAGSQQEIAIEISNPGDVEATFTVSLITASTNRNGIINYTGPGQTDETMRHSFSEIATIIQDDGSITVPPGEVVNVPILIDIPAEGFDGIILGSVHVLLDVTDEQIAASGMIVNRFAHVLVVRLSERDTEIPVEFILGNVTPEIVNYRVSIVAEVRNPQPRLVMGALAHAQVYLAGSEYPVFARSNVIVDFAPNTVFPFTMVDDIGYGLQAGDYVARIQIEHEGLSWDFEYSFVIAPQAATALNIEAINVQTAPQPQVAVSLSESFPIWIIIVAVFAGTSVILAIVSFVKKKRKDKAAYEEFCVKMESLNKPARETDTQEK